jgi:hypothetical protein
LLDERQRTEVVVMSGSRSLTHGIVLGAGLMFLLDPRRGGARRTLVLDKSRRIVREIEDAAGVGARDLAHRAEGVAAHVRHLAGADGDVDMGVDDDVLAERVRATLGKHCSHPHAVRVRAEGSGRIELSGPILGSDVGELIAAVRDVPGVTALVDHLEVHATPEGAPRLEGPPHRHRARPRLSPALKLVVGAVAAGVAATSLVTGNPVGLVIGGAGVLSIARSLNRHGAIPPGRAARRRLEHLESRRPSPSEMPSPL